MSIFIAAGLDLAAFIESSSVYHFRLWERFSSYPLQARLLVNECILLNTDNFTYGVMPAVSMKPATEILIEAVWGGVQRTEDVLLPTISGVSFLLLSLTLCSLQCPSSVAHHVHILTSNETYHGTSKSLSLTRLGRTVDLITFTHGYTYKGDLRIVLTIGISIRVLLDIWLEC